jgi:hypothetical protein
VGLSDLRDQVIGGEIGSVCRESLELPEGAVGPVAIPQGALVSDITDGRDRFGMTPSFGGSEFPVGPADSSGCPSASQTGLNSVLSSETQVGRKQNGLCYRVRGERLMHRHDLL